MIYVLSASGGAVRCMPERVYQGAAEGGKLTLAAPFAASGEVFASFTLPDTTVAGPFRLDDVGAFAEDGGELHCWQRSLPACVTARSGVVRVQFSYTDAAGQKTVSEALSFTVEPGVPVDLTQVPEEGVFDAFTAALADLTSRVEDGQYAARALYGYEQTRVYGANELVFVREESGGKLLRSRAAENAVPPYTDGVLNAEQWEEVLDLTRVADTLDTAESCAASAQRDAASASDSAEAARQAQSAASASAQAAQASEQAATAAQAAAEGAAASAQASEQAAESAASTAAQDYAAQVWEALGETYVPAERFQGLLDGSEQVASAQSAQKDGANNVITDSYLSLDGVQTATGKKNFAGGLSTQAGLELCGEDGGTVGKISADPESGQVSMQVQSGDATASVGVCIADGAAEARLTRPDGVQEHLLTLSESMLPMKYIDLNFAGTEIDFYFWTAEHTGILVYTTVVGEGTTNVTVQTDRGLTIGRTYKEQIGEQCMLVPIIKGDTLIATHSSELLEVRVQRFFYAD